MAARTAIGALIVVPKALGVKSAGKAIGVVAGSLIFSPPTNSKLGVFSSSAAMTCPWAASSGSMTVAGVTPSNSGSFFREIQTGVVQRAGPPQQSIQRK